MLIFCISIILVAIAVFMLSFNVIFRKNGKFPDKEISKNKPLLDRGLICPKAEEKILWSNAKIKRSSCKECDASCCDN